MWQLNLKETSPKKGGRNKQRRHYWRSGVTEENEFGIVDLGWVGDWCLPNPIRKLRNPQTHTNPPNLP